MNNRRMRILSLNAGVAYLFREYRRADFLIGERNVMCVRINLFPIGSLEGVQGELFLLPVVRGYDERRAISVYLMYNADILPSCFNIRTIVSVLYFNIQKILLFFWRILIFN